MKLVNLGSGGFVPPKGWIFVDIHPMKGPPYAEGYIHHDLKNGAPFENDTVDGILSSHFLEHLDAQEALMFLTECRRILKPGGILRMSVPDAEKFYQLTMSNCQDWGEPNGGVNYKPPRSFMHWALFFEQHKQLLTSSALFCLAHAAGFARSQVMPYKHSQIPKLAELDNRPIFSVFVEAVK